MVNVIGPIGPINVSQINVIIKLDPSRNSLYSTKKELGRSVSVVWFRLVDIFPNVGFTFTVVLVDVPMFQCLLQGQLSSHILKPERERERGEETD